MVIYWIVERVLWLLFFYALCSDIYAIWKYYRLKPWDSKAVCIPFVPVVVYALWTYYFMATMLAFKILCFIHFWALVVMPGWCYWCHRNENEKGANEGGQSVPIPVVPAASFTCSIINYFKGGYEWNIRKGCVIGVAALLCAADILYVEWPLHFFYAVEGRASDIRTGKPIRYAVIDDYWASDTPWQPFSSGGSGVSGGMYWTDGNGDYHLPGSFVIFPFSAYNSRYITFTHPLYPYMHRSFTMDKVYMDRVYAERASTKEIDRRRGRAFKADIRAQSLDDKFPSSGKPIDYRVFAYQIRPLDLYIRDVDVLGIGAKVDWPEILAVFRRIQGEGCSGVYACMSSQDNNIRTMENYYRSVSR